MTTSRHTIASGAPECTYESAGNSDADPSESVLRMIEATARTYNAVGYKRLASRLGWCVSKVEKQTRVPEERQAGEPIERADRRGPGEVLVTAVREARKMRAPEDRAAAILIETCAQLGYDALRRVEYVGGVMQGAAEAIAGGAQLDLEIAQAISDKRVDSEERRRIASKARLQIENLRKVIAACENQTLAEVRQIGRQG